MFQIILNALGQTLVMVGSAGFLSLLLGIPLGIFVAWISKSAYKSTQYVHFCVYNVIKIFRTIPFLLILLLFIPITNWLISNHFSYMAATILPLTAAGTFIMIVKVNDITYDLLSKWANASRDWGMTWQRKLTLIILPEALPQIIQEAANTLAILVGFSAIAGALGAGGLGQLAIEKSVTDPNLLCAFASIVILVAAQQLIKYTGSLARIK